MAHAAKNPIAGVGEAAAEKGRWRKTAGRNVAKGRRPRKPAHERKRGREGVKKLTNVHIQLLLRISLSYTVQA
jgi:hypothetical protein